MVTADILSACFSDAASTCSETVLWFGSMGFSKWLPVLKSWLLIGLVIGYWGSNFTSGSSHCYHISMALLGGDVNSRQGPFGEAGHWGFKGLSGSHRLPVWLLPFCSLSTMRWAAFLGDSISALEPAKCGLKPQELWGKISHFLLYIVYVRHFVLAMKR